MPKQIKLDSKTARAKLTARKRPYTTRLAAGIRLAYRRNAKIAGTWSVLGGGGAWLRRIGIADDLELADDHNILDFWQASERALDLARAKDDPDSGKPITVDAALTDYAADLAARDSRAYNAERARIHLSKALAGKTVALLTARELSRWRDGMLTKGLAPASVGRVARMLKAALTRAANHDPRITNRDAWRVGLAGLADGEGGTRNVIIDDDQVRSIIAAAATEGPEFALLVEVAAVTGARPVQIARLQVGDVQADRSDPRLMMPTAAKGRRKVIGRRPVPISADLAFRLRQFAVGRPASALLFPHSDGKGWRGTRHYRPFQRTVKRAVLDPDKVTIYALRHSSISRSLLANVPIRIVAVAHDTSVAMIERTYSRHIADHADTITRGAMLVMEQPAAIKVVTLPVRRS
jgi:integrase